MAVSKKGRFHKHYGKDDRKRSPAELAASLAPAEEQKGAVAAATATSATAQKSSSNNGDGGGSNANGGAGRNSNDDTIIVDSKGLLLSGDFSGEDDNGASLFRLDPAVVVILVLALAFIAFIAYLISNMPSPPR